MPNPFNERDGQGLQPSAARHVKRYGAKRVQ
jgi:hypothetical protein